MKIKKVLGKSLNIIYQENKKDDIKGLNFKEQRNQVNIYFNENKVVKHHIINR